ncbi:radical SAM protein [bacterium]|nr:radical SAM protein [bacterium]
MKKIRVAIVGIYLPGIYPRGDNSVVADLLAPAFLKAAADADPEISQKYEINILNLPASLSGEQIALKILDVNPAIIAYSVYIWNYNLVYESSRLIYESQRSLPIIWGGPQVSYNSFEMMKANPQVKMIVCGSGETRFKLLLKTNLQLERLVQIPGITYRDNQGNIKQTEGSIFEDLSKIPSPYQTKTIDLEDNRRHCVFIETARGCLFKCGYCMAKGEQEKGLNLFPIEQILRDIEIIYNRPNVAEVVFTDSCILYNRDRAKLIIEKILSCSRKIPTVFTLDIAFLDEEMVKELSKLQLSHQQFFFGMQSTNKRTLQLMNRRIDTDIFIKKVALLRKINPATEISFDLIYGLPGDNFEIFKETIEFALMLSPIKLNFSPLLLLPGSPFWEKREEYGFVFEDKPPHQVFYNKYFSIEDMEKARTLVLKVILVMYFPAIREIIYKISDQNAIYRRLELIQRLIEIFENTANFSIDGTDKTAQQQDFIKSNNMVKKRIMDQVAQPENCLYAYRATLQLLKEVNMEHLAEDILLGMDYYKTLCSGNVGRGEDIISQKYNSKQIKWIKLNWVVSKSE